MNTKNEINDMPITTIDLDMTNNCVLACDYCFRGAKNQRRLTYEVGTRAIDWLVKESGNSRKLSVALFGGEPLMEFELIKKLVPYAEQRARKAGKQIHFSATTNCVLINDEMIEFFRKHNMNFHTSIDGGPESQDKHRHFPNGKGTSAIIEPIIRKILKIWPNRTARMSVSNDTVDRWMEDVLYLVGLGYKNLAMIPIPEQDWTEEQFATMGRELRKISDYYIERYRQGSPIYIKHLDDAIKSISSPRRRKSHCGAGRGYVLVKTDGSIYPCHRFGGDIDAESEQKWKLGSIFDGWEGDKRRELLKFDCRKNVKADCENCLAVHMCGTTCIAVSWACFKDIYLPHPNQCRFTKMYFAEAMRVHYILDSEENSAFIKKFHPEKLRRPPHQIARAGRRPQSAGTAPRKGKSEVNPSIVLVMLSNKVLSPCFMFKHKDNGMLRLSLQTFKETLLWATRRTPTMPNLFFLADQSDALDTATAAVLEDIAEQVVVPLLPFEQQKALKIPFSEQQTVIAPNLADVLVGKNHIHNRPIIVHVAREEIAAISDTLLSLKNLTPKITLRLLDASEITNDDIRLYKDQLNILHDVATMKRLLNGGPMFPVNSNIRGAIQSNSKYRCPAGREFVTVGPDGRVYPCPAFFYQKDERHCLHAIDELSTKSLVSGWNPHKCGKCDSNKCPGCPFLEVSGLTGGGQVCHLYQAEAITDN